MTNSGGHIQINARSFLIVSASESIRHDEYASMPLDRIDLYRNLVQMRMIYYGGGFRSHLDIYNKILYGKYFHEADYNERSKIMSIWNMHALSGLLAANLLIDEGIQCTIVNNFDAEFDRITEYAAGVQNPIIGISTTFILQWSEAGRIVKKIRKHIPDAIIILGGAFVHSQHRMGGAETLKKPMAKYKIDYVLYGFNSERDIADLLRAFKGELPLLNVNNMIHYNLSSNCYIHTEAKWHPPILSVSEKAWRLAIASRHDGLVQVRTSSGCPFKCAFCNYPKVASGFHHSSIDEVRKQLDAIRDTGAVNTIVFIDDTINVPKGRFTELVSLMGEYQFTWYAFFRVQFIDDELACAMRASGCDGLYLGLESGSDIVLSNMNKRAKVADFLRGIDILRKHGITTFASFIVGFPGETKATIEETIDFIERSGLEFYSLKEFYYLHDSPVYAMASEYGLEGEGHQWSHSTMNSIEASRSKMEIFNRVNASAHIDPDMGLWYLIYMKNKGFGWDRIKDIQAAINKMIRQDNEGEYDGKEPLFHELTRLLKSANPSPAE